MILEVSAVRIRRMIQDLDQCGDGGSCGAGISFFKMRIVGLDVQSRYGTLGLV